MGFDGAPVGFLRGFLQGRHQGHSNGYYKGSYKDYCKVRLLSGILAMRLGFSMGPQRGLGSKTFGSTWVRL